MEPASRVAPVPPSRRIAQLAAVAVAYTLLGRLGLLLDPVAGFASVVWGPTGLAIAATLILGYQAAVGVWIGALVVNMLAGASPAVAGMVATGNTLEAVVAAMLLRRLVPFDDGLRRLGDVLGFILLAAALAPVVSASIGVATLASAGIVQPELVGTAWRAWWVGDCIGAILVAPPILVVRAHGLRDLASRGGEIAGLTLALVLLLGAMFFGLTPLEGAGFLPAYLIIPLLMWAALRFEQRGAVMAVLLTSIIAIAATVRGHGPFVEPQLRDSLFQLQTFIGMIAVSMLALGAAIAEREEASRRSRELLLSVEAANHAKSDFLAAMSHELRTPLNAIGGYAQLLGMGVHGELSDVQRDAVRRIDTNQRHLATLVDDILSFTRMEAGRLTLRIGRVPVSKLLAQLREMVGIGALRRDVTVVVEQVQDGLAANADVERSLQILLNLTANAIKFSRAGGQVDVTAAREGAFVVIRVRDRGIGIPVEQLERVFEPFYQVERGHSRRYTGVGLGLTISRDLARAMGGDVTLASLDGHGTTASLSLPAATQP